MEDKEQHHNHLGISNLMSLSFSMLKQNIKFYLLLGLVLTVLSFIISNWLLQKGTSDWSLIIISILIFVIIYAKFAVMVHRSILLKEFDLKQLTTWFQNDMRFTAWMLALIVIIAILVYVQVNLFLSFMPNFTIVKVFTITTILVATYIASRIIFVFPSIAVEKQLSLTECWKVTANHKLTMYVITIILPLTATALLHAIPDQGLIWSFIGNFIATIVTIFEIIIISYAYSLLVP